MTKLRSILTRVVAMFRRRELDERIDDELLFHIEMETEENIRQGMSASEARRQALLQLGGMQQTKEDHRDVRGIGWLDELARNLRYAGRSMRKSPGFTAIAVLSLALGIGANVAVFSFVQKLMLGQLKVPDPGRLRVVAVSSPSGVGYAMSYPMFEEIRSGFSAFSGVLAWSVYYAELAVGDHVESARGMGVSGGYLEALGIHPLLGRFIAESDEASKEAASVVALSYGAWQRIFGGDPGVLGQTLKIDDIPHQIIGVVPPEFFGTELDKAAEFYIPPQRFWNTQWQGYGWHVMARLKSDVSPEAAQAELDARWPNLDSDRLARIGRRGRPDFLLLEEGRHGYTGVGSQFGYSALALMALVGVVFLIGCANLATLLLVRGVGRVSETSVRLALGASRAQIARQWMTESLLLAVAGGLCGLVVANWIAWLLLHFVPESSRPYFDFHLDASLLCLTSGLTVAAGFLFGLPPAWRASRALAEAALHQNRRSVAGGRGRILDWLLAGQLAASLVLVAGAILFARTLWNLNTASGGFDRNVVMAIPAFSQAHWPKNRWRTGMNEIVALLSHFPRVASVSIGLPPLGWGESFGWVTVPGYDPSQEESNLVYQAGATPEYFRTLSIPLLAGREFDERDTPPPWDWSKGPRPVPDWAHAAPIIVNESFVRHYFKDRNPLGAVVTFNQIQRPGRIVGVVGNVKHLHIRDAELDAFYYPLPPDGMANLLVCGKPGVPPTIVEEDVRAAIKIVLKTDNPGEIDRLEDHHQRQIGRDRLVAELSAALGLFGVLLASMGLYGTMAHVVASRTREIGIRMALGADRSRVVRMVIRRSLGVTALGILIGCPLALAGSRAVASLLFGISPDDPLTFASSAAVLAAVGLSASWRPARGAASVHPVVALRHD